jgi:hypothetical protein
LHVRVHLLPRLHVEEARLRLRQLWRRACSAPDSSGSEAREEPSIEVAGDEVDAVCATSLNEPTQAANKAPEPTTFAVTSRAIVRTFEMKRSNLNRDAARAAPAKVVAHL